MGWYRALLHLYPRSFQAEYGDELAAIARTRAREARSPVAKLWLGLELAVDTLTSAAAAHADQLRQDVRHSARSLRRSPGFAATAIVVSGLGLGATTAAFSMADHVLLRPLPFPDADRLVKLYEDQSARGYSRMELSPPNYLDWKRLSRSFAGMAAYTQTAANLVGAGSPERLEGAWVTPDLFQVLDRPALIGRTLGAADERPGAPDVVVISERLWRRRFDQDPEVLGRSVTLNDRSYVVVGVMPGTFVFPGRTTDYWTRFSFREENGDGDRNNNYLRGVGRLAPGVSLPQARSELQLVAAQLAAQFPKENGQTGAAVVRLRDEISAQPRLLLIALAGASLCVLLIASTNLANLFLSRALSRQNEMSIRTAIGASPDRLVRQMLTESLMLAGLGGLLGLAIGLSAIPLVARLAPTVLPIAETPTLDLRMLGLAGMTTVATGVLFGLAPAWRVGRRSRTVTLSHGQRTGTSRRTERLRSWLVVGEVAMSVMLLVAAGLLIRALVRVQAIDPGFQQGGVVTLRTSLPTEKYGTTSRRVAFYRQVIDETRALPGVTDAAYTSFLPMVMRGGIWPVIMPGSAATDSTPHYASLRFVTPGYFEALGTPMRMGRDVSDADTSTSPLVAVVSESFVRQHWPDADPLGQVFTIGLAERMVVGVVGDVKVRGLERESEPQAYLPAAQQPDGGLAFYRPQDLLVRSRVPPATLVPALRAIIERADPEQPVSAVRLLEDVVADETAPRRVQVRILGAFAALALVLAAIGIHGTLAFNVAARTREIGVRLALGAKPSQMLARVLGEGLALAAIGVTIGGLAALAIGRLMQSLLAGVDPADLPTLAIAAGLAGLMTVAGSVLPAVRAMRVDPLNAIRSE